MEKYFLAKDDLHRGVFFETPNEVEFRQVLANHNIEEVFLPSSAKADHAAICRLALSLGVQYKVFDMSKSPLYYQDSFLPCVLR
jgi:hypothetical protein